MADGAESSSPDKDFEPSAELLVHNYDDEGTLEEEENLSTDSGDNNELDDLQKESDMPLESLLAMYGYGAGPTAGAEHHQESHGSTSEEEILNNHDLTLDKEEVARDILRNDDDSETSLDDLIENVEPNSTLQLLNGSGGDDGEDEDEDYLPTIDDEAWKKSIQVGADYQAAIPDLIGQVERDHVLTDEHLLWDPTILDEDTAISFLKNVQAFRSTEQQPSVDNRVHDDEQALYLLLQSDFNVDEALRRRKLQTAPPSDPLSLWSEDECQNFESGLRVHGKNFFAIHQNKVRTRSVGELVQFYYFWKKTERREAFCNRGRIEKKKLCVNPGITDYMDRFGERPDGELSAYQPEDCYCPQVPVIDSANAAMLNSTEPVNEYARQEVANTETAQSDTVSTKRNYVDSSVASLPYSSSEELSSQGTAKRLRVDPILYHTNVPTEVGN